MSSTTGPLVSLQPSPLSGTPVDHEAAVRSRYGAAAQAVQPELCCPVTYQGEYLSVIPAEILERDYGCGDPTRYVREGDIVVDLGSGGGKVCYILSQVVGPMGRVIGVDCNREMLALARRHQTEVTSKIGYDNIEFRYGRIQDLRLDLDRLSTELAGKPVSSAEQWLELHALEERLRHTEPMLRDQSVDCVVSNCVLNLVRPEDRSTLLAEVFRVLKVGGRVAISDIVSDEDVPAELQRDPTLWSGCLSGAYREDRLLQAFEEAGFHGVSIAERGRDPWRTVQGIEFRSVTVTASKGKQGPCFERLQAVIYRGPFKQVVDDDGHTYYRGERMAVCDKTFKLLQREPYTGMFIPVTPSIDIPLAFAQPFNCRTSARRAPHESKGQGLAPNPDRLDSPDECSGSDCC